MKNLISFDFDDSSVRAVMISEAPWFVANEVCAVLEISNPRHAVSSLDDDERGVVISDTPGGPQSLNVVSESGMFCLIFKSRKPEAQRFRRWVTGEVLPALRRHGHYHLPLPATEIPADFDSARLSSAVAAVREARRLFGQQSARVVWMKLGLPAPIADSADGLEADPLAIALEDYLARVGETTIEDAAIALGLGNPDGSTRLRIGALLRLFGWFPRKQRVNGRPVNLFTPRTAKEA